MDAYWQSELSLVFDKECPSLSPSWQMGVKLLCGGHEMSKGMYEHVCTYCSTHAWTLHKWSHCPKKGKRQSKCLQTHSYQQENQKVLWSGRQQFLRWCVCLNCTISAPVDGSVTHKSIQGALKTCMMAEHLCKLASCVSGIQMALSLCLLCSRAQRRIKERSERKPRAECFRDKWKSRVVSF